MKLRTKIMMIALLPVFVLGIGIFILAADRTANGIYDEAYETSMHIVICDDNIEDLLTLEKLILKYTARYPAISFETEKFSDASVLLGEFSTFWNNFRCILFWNTKQILIRLLF